MGGRVIEAAKPADIRDEIVHLTLATGEPVCLRTIRAGDGARMRDGIARMSPRSRYLRFFSGAEEQPDSVIDSLLDVDGISHIAWGAIASAVSGAPAIGAVHAVATEEPDKSAMEFSVAVVDAWQGLGLARLLTAALLVNCLARGVERLEAYLLSENHESQDFVKGLGGRLAGSDGNVYHYAVAAAPALDALRNSDDSAAMAALLAQLSRHLAPVTPGQ